MLAALDVRLALGDLVGRDPRRREELHEVGAGEVLERPGVGDLVDAAADEQVAGQRAGGRVVDHLVDLELVVARAGLEEEVVRQVLDQVAGGEDVVAVPRLADESWTSAPAPPAMKCCGLRAPLTALQRAGVAGLAFGRRR